jgi:hypothetical protein
MSSTEVRRDRRAIAVSIKTWTEVNEGVLSETDAATFKKRMESINLYARGFSLKKITQITNIESKDLYRFLDRCEAGNRDGTENGWRGIIPRGRLGTSKSSKTDQNRLGHANQFNQFLSCNPEIKQNLEFLAKDGKRAGEKGPKRKLSVQQIKAELIKDCRQAGFTASDYPLNIASHAYGSIRRFVAMVRGQMLSASSVGTVSTLPILRRYFQRLEADGHWKDVCCTVELPSPTDRGVYYLPIERLWLIPVLETKSTAALGYSIAYGTNYSGGDLIRGCRSAALPWVPLELTAKGLKYCENGGFPSGVDERLAYVCSDEILLDNHKGHLSDFSIEQIHRTLGATPVYGSINNPNARACAEGFFARIEEEVFHRLPSSIGSTEKNRDIKNPTKNAIKYHITDLHIREIAEVALAHYNSESPPGSSLSRIELLQRYVADPRSLVRRIPLEERNQIRLYDLELEWTIKGNIEKGIRPHCYYLESRYTNPVIAASYGLIGKKLKVYGYSGDIRTFDASFESGASAGTLLCERRFRNTPHSVQTRKHANASRRTGSHQPNSMGDEIAGFKEALTTKAPTSKFAATELARINAEARENLQRQKSLGATLQNVTKEPEENEHQTQGRSNNWDDKLSKLGTQF